MLSGGTEGRRMRLVQGLALLCLTWAAACLGSSPSPAPAQDGPGRAAVIVLDVSGAIGPGTTDYLKDGIARAARDQARLVVVRLDTPGGLASSTRDIVMAILASPIPVVTFVAPAGARAASAGTYIVYASHLAAMAPTTHLGAATPISLGGSGRPDQDKKEGVSPPSAAESKVINDAVASIRGLAELLGRDPGFAERAVREAATLTAREAQAQRVIEIIARDLPDLLHQANGRTVRVQGRDVTLSLDGATLVEFAPDWRAQILSAITNPNIAYILLLAGIYGLLFEFISPGAVFPGVGGGIALLVALYALNLLPVSYAGAGLLLLGVALMTAETFLPSFGVVGVGGLVAFALGSLFLFPADLPGIRVSLPVVAVATAASAAFLVFALSAAWRAHHRSVATGEAVLLGSTGLVLAWTGDTGEIQVHGERWRATAGAPLRKGQRVRVLAREGLTLTVAPQTEPDPP
jgi:membrane-bound serine protease (ClpP class)